MIRQRAPKLLPLLLGVAFPLGAQQSEVRDSVHHSNDCRLAEQVLSTGNPKPNYDWALELIVSCGPGAADVVAALWKRPPADTAGLFKLFIASSRFRDGRIYNAANAVVADRSKPDLVRLTALGVLASFAQPGVVLDFKNLRRLPPGPFMWQNPFGRMSHSLAEEGVIPLPSDVTTQVNRLVHELASGPPGGLVRDSAFHLKTLLGLR